jgi:hypothetical protein
MGIDLHIEELVLHGFAARDRHKIAEAVQIELTHLLSAQAQANFLKGSISLERINGGAFKVQAGGKPQSAGIEIARAVFRSLRQHARISASAARTRPGIGGRHP